MSDIAYDKYSARGSRTPCPECGRVGTMTLEGEWIVKEGSIAGKQIKALMELFLYIVCGAEDVEGCGWRKRGRISETGHFEVPAEES